MQVLLEVVGIPISSALDLHHNYNVPIIGSIPQGLPKPSLPDFQLIPELILDSFLIAVAGFAFTLSMAKMIAKNFNKNFNIPSMGIKRHIWRFGRKALGLLAPGTFPVPDIWLLDLRRWDI